MNPQDEKMYRYVITKVPELANEPDKEKVINYGYHKTGIKREQSGMLEQAGKAFTSGFGQRNEPQEGIINKTSAFVGENVAPTVGAMMGAPAGIPGMMAGAAAGRATQKAIAQGINVAKPGFAAQETPGQVVADVGIQAAAEGAAGTVGLGAKALKASKGGQAFLQKAADLAGSITHKATGINLRNAITAWRAPEVLFKAGDPEATGKAVGAFKDSFGMDAEARSRTFFGSANPGVKKVEQEFYDATDFMHLPEAQAGEAKILLPKLIALRDQIKLILSTAKPEEKKVLENIWVNRIKQVDSWITQQAPEWKALLDKYADAKVKDSFMKLLPTVYEKGARKAIPDWTRIGGATAVAGAGLMKGHPAGVAALPGISPIVHGLGISGLYGLQKFLDIAEKTGMTNMAMRPAIAHFMSNANPAEQQKIAEILKAKKIAMDPNSAINDPLGLFEATDEDLIAKNKESIQ